MLVHRRYNNGFTLPELIIYIVIFAILSLFFSLFFTNVLKGTKLTQIQTEAQEELRTAMSQIENTLYEANQILISRTTEVMFICDITKNHNYNLYGDFDGDGIINIEDSDDDNDSPQILPPAQRWRVGYDLKDDDDNNNGRVDVKVRIWYVGKTVFKDISYDEEHWGNHVERLAQNISTFSITYFGSRREDLGKNIDLGNDGVGGTNDTGENDGIITSREIDWVLPPRGHGNRSGQIDTPDELRYISTINIKMALDKNNDGTDDAKIETEIWPPMLILKRR